jgi:hypothetical protein
MSGNLSYRNLSRDQTAIQQRRAEIEILVKIAAKRSGKKVDGG